MSYKSVARRKSLRRKQAEPRSWLQIVLIFLLCASVLFAVAVLLGNYLKSIAGPDPSAPGTGEKPAPEQDGYFHTSEVPVILAAYGDSTASAPLIGSGAVFGEKIYYNASSLVLRTADTSRGSSAVVLPAGAVKRTGMRLTYTSEFVSLEPFDEAGSVPLATLLGEAKKQFAYTAGTFALGFVSEPEVTRHLVREYEISLLAELYANGMDDVILTDVPEQSLPEAIAFIRDVRERTDGGLKLGIALSFSYLESKDVKSKINALHYDCGFLALDLRNEAVPTLMTPESFVFDRVSRIASTLSLYSVRVIVGIGPVEGYHAEAEAAFRAGSLNIMAVPKNSTVSE